MPASELISDSERARVAQLLGREPRGLQAIQVRNANGEPSVIRVASLVGGKPFPTLFWLVDKQLNYWLDGLEAVGKISDIQRQIDSSAELQAQLASDHLDYIATRECYMLEATKIKLIELNYYVGLQQRGIGGIADFGRVRCLHTHYAAHLVRPNTVGSLVDRLRHGAGLGLAGGLDALQNAELCTTRKD